MATAHQTHVIFECLERMHAIRLTHSDWFARYDDAQVDPGTPQEQIVELIESAPNGFAAGVLFGKLMMRQHFAAAVPGCHNDEAAKD